MLRCIAFLAVKKCYMKVIHQDNGYAYTKYDDYIRVFYLSCLINAAVIYKDEEIVETNMEDIEVQIVFDYCHKNKEFREKAGLVKLFVKMVELNRLIIL